MVWWEDSSSSERTVFMFSISKSESAALFFCSLKHLLRSLRDGSWILDIIDVLSVNFKAFLFVSFLLVFHIWIMYFFFWLITLDYMSALACLKMCQQLVMCRLSVHRNSESLFFAGGCLIIDQSVTAGVSIDHILRSHTIYWSRYRYKQDFFFYWGW